jgi:hypothetical protein
MKHASAYDGAEVMKGVSEYAEGYDVVICKTDGFDLGSPIAGRLVVLARNQGGHDCTKVDLLELIAWLKANKPELL